MSGLAGMICLDGRPADRETLERMADAAPHLGPEGAGCLLSGPAGLLHLHRATTPEAAGERQPLENPDAGWALTFDGRLDNRADLWRSLPARERPAPEAPDSAYVLAAWAAWGEACPDRLVGDFTLALWQSRERRLFCARSPRGFRPFVWASDGRTLWFASEVGALGAGSRLTPRLNEGFLGEVLACCPTTVTETLWDGVFSLAPGGAMTVDAGGKRRAWRWYTGPFPDVHCRDDREYEEGFRHLLTQAVQSSLRSIGPVAFDLSGGLDSSSLVCLAAELQRTGRTATAMQPFSLVFPGEPQDESVWIDQVAAHTGQSVVRVTPPPYDWGLWRRESWESRDLPLRPNAATRRVVLAAMQERGCRVVVGGEGGDDWLRGSHAHWPDLLRRGRWAKLWQEARTSEAVPLSPRRTLRRFLGAGVLPLVSRPERERLLYGRLLGEVPPWIAPEWARAICLADRLRAVPALPPALSGMGRRWLYGQNLGRTALTQPAMDRLNAQLGMEQRNPLHDRRLFEFILGLPGDQMRRDGWRKSLLRRALQGTVPDAVRLRRDKAEFGTPIRAALEQLGDPLPLPHLDRRGWLRREQLPAGFVRWNAAAVETVLAQTASLPGISADSME